jgi:outer membrane autotransporter protein
VDDKTNVLYQVGYSYQDTSSQRDIAFMSTSAKADYDSHVESVDVRVLRDYPINDKVLLQPLVSTTYRYFKTANYSESGAGSLNLNVKDFSSSEFILGLGTLAYYQINNESKLFGNVNVGYDLKDDNNIVTSSYQGASGLSFETEGIDNGRWTYDLGFGYENDLTELSNLSFTYNFQGEGSDYTNHVISAKYTFKF